MRQELVAQREQAGGLQPDDGNAAFEERRGGGEDAAGLGAGLLDQARRQERAPAAQRPPSPSTARSRVDAIAEAGEHLDGGVQVLGLEVGVEGVGEQRDLAVVATASPSP